MKTYCYINGKIVTSNKMFVSAYDIGLLRGYAIYEGMTTRNSKTFYLKSHLKRFRKSAQKLKIKIPLTDEKISRIISLLIKKNGFNRTNLRMILTAGETVNGIGYNKDKSTFFILAENCEPLPNRLYKNGGKLMTREHLRFMPSVKTTNYIAAVGLQNIRKKVGAIEILFVHQGKVLECSTSNIFIFNGNTLTTPKNNVLLGITREAVMDVAKKHFKTEIRDISTKELFKASEVFITSSFKDIVPIVKIDKRKVGNGKVGKNTLTIMNLFSKLIK